MYANRLQRRTLDTILLFTFCDHFPFWFTTKSNKKGDFYCPDNGFNFAKNGQKQK